MELKTLKELSECCNDGAESMTIRAFSTDLKQEAIKWVKELEKEEGSILIENILREGDQEINLDDNIMILRNLIYESGDRIKVAHFLRYLYNITGEDLQ